MKKTIIIILSIFLAIVGSYVAYYFFIIKPASKVIKDANNKDAKSQDKNKKAPEARVNPFMKNLLANADEVYKEQSKDYSAKVDKNIADAQKTGDMSNMKIEPMPTRKANF